MLETCHLQLHEGGRAGFPPKQVMLFWVLCSWGGTFVWLHFSSCTVKQLKSISWEKWRNTSLFLGWTLNCFSVLSMTCGGIVRVFPRPPPIKHHLQTWRCFHKLFHVIRFQQCICSFMHECTRTGWSVCYCCMVAIQESWTQKGFLQPCASGINLSPVHSAFKFTDLYRPVIPSHSCQRLGNFEHWSCLAILQVESCRHQGLEGISQPLEFSSLDYGNI